MVLTSSQFTCFFFSCAALSLCISSRNITIIEIYDTRYRDIELNLEWKKIHTYAFDSMIYCVVGSFGEIGVRVIYCVRCHTIRCVCAATARISHTHKPLFDAEFFFDEIELMADRNQCPMGSQSHSSYLRITTKLMESRMQRAENSVWNSLSKLMRSISKRFPSVGRGIGEGTCGWTDFCHFILRRAHRSHRNRFECRKRRNDENIVCPPLELRNIETTEPMANSPRSRSSATVR